MAAELKVEGLVRAYESTTFGFNGRVYTTFKLDLTPAGAALAKRFEDEGAW